jgi:hypothetical protein
VVRQRLWIQYRGGAPHVGRKRSFGLRFAAWLSVLFGAYGILAVASLWGFPAGVGSAALGLVVAVAVLTDRPAGRTWRVARVGLVLNALALLAAAALLVVLLIVER